MCENLPSELLFHIFSNLDVPAIATAALVCKDWMNATKEPLLWQFLLKRDYPEDFDETASDCFELYKSVYFPVAGRVVVRQYARCTLMRR